jgi:hypothetical protein
MGATFNPGLAESLFTMTAWEARLRGTHQALTPVVDVVRDPRWGRVEETYGEDPYLVSRMPENAKDAFFELVLFPTKACYQVNELYITAGKNRLYADQRRACANDLAARAKALFQADANLSDSYNDTLANGKWDHMMDQTHIGYTNWQEPPVNAMPSVKEIEVPEAAEMGVAVEGSIYTWPRAQGEPVLPDLDPFNRPRRYIDVFNRGRAPFEFSVTADVPWIVLSAAQGKVEKEQRIWVSVDWRQAPQRSANGYVRIGRAGPDGVTVRVTAFNPPNPSKPTRSTLEGFVEANGYVSIEAEHFTKKTNAGAVRWEKIEDYGRTLSAVTVFPVTAKSVTPPRNSPCIEYRMYLFHFGKIEVEAMIAPTVNFVPGRGLRFAVSFDGQPPQVVDALAQNSQADWEESVKDNVRKVKSTHMLATSGYHTLKFWMVDPSVVLEKLVVNLGGLRPSYLGPPESYRGGNQ